MKIALVSISVNDPVAAHKFYTEKLGFVSKVFSPEALFAIVASPDDPAGTKLLLEPRGHLGSKQFFDSVYDAGLPVIVFGTRNIERDCKELKAKGVVFHQELEKAENGNGTQAIFDDTCGNLIQLHES